MKAAIRALAYMALIAACIALASVATFLTAMPGVL
jgi:hypothetical protein